MSKTLPDDYEESDGWDNSRGVEQCPHCTVPYSPNDGHTGPVYDKQGRRYEYHLNTDPGDGPFFCSDCWDELETNLKASENQTITEWIE